MPEFPKISSKDIPDLHTTPISDLVTLFKGCIDLIRKELGKELDAHKAIEKADPNFGDDIFLTRFLMQSYKKGYDKVKKYLRETMKWRAANAALLVTYRGGAPPPNDETFRTYGIGAYHFRNKNGDLVMVMRNGLGNPDLVLEKIKPVDVTNYIVHCKEHVYAICDAETRQKNRLIQMVSVLDFANAANLGSGKFRDAATEATTQAEYYYPMLVGKSVMFNVPTFLRAVMKVALFVMPSSMQEKLIVCSEDTVEESIAFAEKHLGLEKKDLPTFLGGTCDCGAEGCCMGIPNAQTTIITAEECNARRLPTWEEYMARCGDRATYKKNKE